MVPMMMPAAREIAELLRVASSGPLRVLDVAAGHGIFGIVIAQKNSQAEVVAVDWKGVLNVASDNAKKMGVAARHRTLAGDAFKVAFGDGFDLALMTNFLHHFDVPTCTSLLAKVARSLKAGGRIAILEFVPNDDRVSPPLPAAFALQMLAGTPGGDAFTLADLSGMLKAAGLSDVAAHPLHGPQTLVVARKA
jgi:ubiquinone/menaquinone biosynthesis C-methylase UbiE